MRPCKWFEVDRTIRTSPEIGPVGTCDYDVSVVAKLCFLPAGIVLSKLEITTEEVCTRCSFYEASEETLRLRLIQ